MDKLEQIKQKIQEYQNKTAVTQDLKAFLTLVLSYIKTAKDDFSSISKDNLVTIAEALKYIETEHKGIMESVSQETKGVKEDFEKKLKEANDYLQEVKAIKLTKGDKGEDGLNGINPNPEDVVPFVLELLPEPKEVTGEEIADKLEALQGEAKLDFKALKNIPEWKGGKTGGVVARNIYQMGDVSLTSLANNDVLKWDDTNKLWVNGVGGGAGTIDGSGTTNELTYWVDSNTVGSLSTATYPSLTELSYVKGVTSAIQTQLNAKAPTTSPTFATSITGSYLTASEILITDGSKNIVSAPVATYPSLTELTYLKGVTSAIQTQLNGKANTALSNLASVAINASLLPGTSDTVALGSTTKMWSDLFLASGGVINWNNGTYTITQSGTDLTFSGDIIFSNALTSTSDWDATSGGAMTFSALTTAGAAEAGKNVEFYAGAGGAGDTNGGIVKLKGGAKSGAGTDGYTYIVDPTSNLGAILNVASIATTDKTFTFPNRSLTIDNITTSTTTNGTGFLKGNGSVISFDNSTYTPTSTTITIAGTANQITSSAGAQDLSANRTWTLSFPADVIIPTVLTVPNTGLHLLDTNASHDLIIKPGSNITADRTLTITTGDTDMIVDFTAVTDEYLLAYDVGTNTWRGVAPGAGTGDVVGPASSTDNAIVRFDSTTGKLIQNNTQWTIDDNGKMAGVISTEEGFSLTTSLGAGAGNNLMYLEATNAAWDRPMLRIVDSTTSGGAANIRIDSPNPDIEFVESDQVSPAGKFEVAVNADKFQLNGRNTLDNSFEPIFTAMRYGAGGMMGLGTAYDTPNAMLEIVGTATPTYLFALSSAVGATSGNILEVDLAGNLVYNERGSSVDLRAEGDTDANLFFLDGSADMVGIGTSTPAQKLHVKGRVQFGVASNTSGTIDLANSGAAGLTRISPAAPGSDITITLPGVDATLATLGANTFTALQTISLAGVGLRVVNTTDNASVQVAKFEGDRATMADNDEGYLSLILSDNGGNQDEQARITFKATTVAAGATQDGQLIFSTLLNNSLTTVLTLGGATSLATFAGAVTATAGTVTLATLAGAIDAGGATSFEIPNGAGGTTVDAAGEVCVDTTSKTLNFYDGAAEKVLTPVMSKSITIESPTATEDLSMFYTDDAITITKIVFVITGSTSVTTTIRHHTDRSNAGNEVVTGGTTANSTTTGNVVTSFNDATIPADSFVWLETTALSGTPTTLNVTIFYTQDA